MRVQAIFLVGLMVGMAGCSAADDSTGGTAGTGNAAGTAGTGGSGNGGSGNGGSGNGGSGAVGATGGNGGTTGGSGGATGGSGGATGGSGGATGGSGGATGGSGGATGGSGGTGGTTPTCTPITLSNFARVAANQWVADINPELGTADIDGVSIEFYGASAGTTNLSSPPNDNYATCERCVRAVQDANATPATQYYQSAGSMNLVTANGRSGSISNVTLVEVTYAADFTSTPVSGGKCLTIASASWADAANSCSDGGVEYTSTDSCGECQDAEYAAGGCCSAEADACSANASCGALITCINACAANDTACFNTCETNHNAGVNDVNALLDCVFGPTAGDDGACGIACQ